MQVSQSLREFKDCVKMFGTVSSVRIIVLKKGSGIRHIGECSRQIGNNNTYRERGQCTNYGLPDSLLKHDVQFCDAKVWRLCSKEKCKKRVR